MLEKQANKKVILRLEDINSVDTIRNYKSWDFKFISQITFFSLFLGPQKFQENHSGGDDSTYLSN